VLFKTGFSSDPEIVGQPIETVIHDRERDSRLGNGRATLGFEQNRAKNFPGIEWVLHSLDILCFKGLLDNKQQTHLTALNPA